MHAFSIHIRTASWACIVAVILALAQTRPAAAIETMAREALLVDTCLLYTSDAADE